MSLENFLSQFKGLESSLKKVLEAIYQATKEIDLLLRNTSGFSKESNEFNKFGENQLKIDILADEIIREKLKSSKQVNACVSEELIEVNSFNYLNADYFVAYDPLDGSSLVKNNLSVGSIFGIWKDDSLMGKTGQEQVAAVYVVYGIKMTFVLAIKNQGVRSLTVHGNKKLEFNFKKNILNKDSNYFSFGNLKACIENKYLYRLLNYYIDSKKTLRYTGCLVSDVNKIISGDEGIFIYGSSPSAKDKLRLVYECNPVAFIFKESGGKTINQLGKLILEIPIANYEQTTSIIGGSLREVDKVFEIIK